MLKQSYANSFRSDQLSLYDKIRGDLYENKSIDSLQVPSITTMFLLQIQAYIIKLSTQLPSKSSFTATTTTLQKSSSLSLLQMIENKRIHLILSVQFFSFQGLHWFLLILMVLLDNVARFLNVEHEMAEIKQTQTNNSVQSSFYIDENPYRFIDQQSKQKKTTQHLPSEPSSPTHPKAATTTLVNASSPIHSPRPNFVVRQRNHHDESRVPTRSLSNTMVDQKKLRRIHAQREINVQSAVSQPRTKKIATSIISHSSSGSSSTTRERPRMQKTVSLSTAQQYHHHEGNQKMTAKPYERCCTACSSNA